MADVSFSSIPIFQQVPIGTGSRVVLINIVYYQFLMSQLENPVPNYILRQTGNEGE